MKVSLNKIQCVIDALQNIVDEAENREVDKINTRSNTYGLSDFISFGSDGYLDLDADIDDLIDEPDDEE